MKIVVIGSGYVGLVAGTCFAESGNHVCCIDINRSKVERLSNGDPVIYEPGLETLLKKNIKSKRISFSTNPSDVVPDADVIFTAVGTPTGDDGSAELEQLFSAVKSIAPLLSGHTLVVNKCTAPVGTVEKIKELLLKNVSKGVEFDVASNPEFLKEGVALQDFMYPDRVVVGVESKKAEEILRKLYEPFLRNGNPIHVMDIRSAELTKYACNSFLATKISFMNDMAELCERMGADVNAVRTGMSTDHRIGKSFLYPGVGYGGSCFPKDVKALINTANKYDVELDIVKSAEHVNKMQRDRFIKKVLNHFKGNIKDVTVAVWGLSFKPQTDDMREAPSITIIQELCKNGAKVRASDPVALSNAKASIKADVEYFEDHFEALKGATALVILTEWNEYRTCDMEKLKKYFNGKVIFDGRNIWSGSEVRHAGFEYYGVGRN